MSDSGVCTSCGASAELNADENCTDCAGGSMESQPADESTASEPADESTASDDSMDTSATGDDQTTV